MKKTDDLCCPFCGSDRGVYRVDYYSMAQYHKFSGEPDGGSEPCIEQSWKRYRCQDCRKMMPKKFNDELTERILNY